MNLQSSEFRILNKTASKTKENYRWKLWMLEEFKVEGAR
jgi:hypothetical protein